MSDTTYYLSGGLLMRRVPGRHDELVARKAGTPPVLWDAATRLLLNDSDELQRVSDTIAETHGDADDLASAVFDTLREGLL